MFGDKQFSIFSTSNSEFDTTLETNDLLEYDETNDLLEFDDDDGIDLEMLLNTPSPKHVAEDLTIVNYQQGSEHERSEQLAHLNQDEDSVTVNEQGMDQNTPMPENDVAADPAMDEPSRAAANNRGKGKAPLKKLEPRKRKGEGSNSAEKRGKGVEKPAKRRKTPEEIREDSKIRSKNNRDKRNAAFEKLIAENEQQRQEMYTLKKDNQQLLKTVRELKGKSTQQFDDVDVLARTMVSPCTDLDDDDTELERILMKTLLSLAKEHPNFPEYFARFKEDHNAQARAFCEKILPGIL